MDALATGRKRNGLARLLLRTPAFDTIMNSTPPIEVLCSDEAATARLAGMLAKVLPPRVMIALNGTLGAGKTHLVRDVVAALGGEREEVVSPTFVLCQHYQCGDRRVHHLDAYRMKDDDEFLELGVEELFESDAITFVEWAERVEDCLPDDRLEISIEVAGETARRFRFETQDATLAERLGSLDPTESTGNSSTRSSD